MEYNELRHWGIKGMKWGVRRFQNKDGSLTKAGKQRYGDGDEESKESVEERRNKALKSTNAEEIYKNRDVLTTAELNERINRINAEQNLANISARSKKTGYDYVDKALKLGRKVNEVYEFTNTPVMKALKKQLMGDTKPKKYTLDEVIKNYDKMSDSDVKNTINKTSNYLKLLELQNKMNNSSNKKDNRVDLDDVIADKIKELLDQD